MTQNQHVVIRPVPQYEPALESEPTCNPAAKWEQHLAVLERPEDPDR